MLTALLSHTATAQSAIAAAQTVDIKKRCFVKASPRRRYGRNLRLGSQVWQAGASCLPTARGMLLALLALLTRMLTPHPPVFFRKDVKVRQIAWQKFVSM